MIRTDESLFKDRTKITNTIAHFWDQTTHIWRKIWGPHIHHGFYEKEKQLTPLEAQENLIEKLTQLLNITSEDRILDVGCGMGGSSFYLAKKYHANVIGISLSQKQIAIAKKDAEHLKLSNVSFLMDDALTLKNFKEETFDLVWSLESCEQFYDKDLFLKQVMRVLKPGGHLMLATWVSDRDEYYGKNAIRYKKLCHAFDLPYMPSLDHYQFLLTKNHFIIQDRLDWSSHVKNTWNEGLSLINAYSFLSLLKMLGFRTFRAIKQLRLMRDAFQNGTIKYGVLIAKKAE